MSERERWIVYPLLFLAIAASLKDKFVPSDIKANTIECNEIQCRTKITSRQLTCLQVACQQSVIADLTSRRLVIVDEGKKPKIVLNTSGNGQEKEGESSNQAPNKPGAGRIELLGPSGNTAVTMGTLSDGGYIAVSHDQRQAHVLLTHSNAGSGLFFVGAEGASSAMSAIEPDVVDALPSRAPTAISPLDSDNEPQDEKVERGTNEDAEDGDAKPEDGKTNDKEAEPAGNSNADAAETNG